MLQEGARPHLWFQKREQSHSLWLLSKASGKVSTCPHCPTNTIHPSEPLQMWPPMGAAGLTMVPVN